MPNIGDAFTFIVEGTALGPICMIRGALTKADRCFDLFAKTVAALAKLPDNDYLWFMTAYFYWAACPGYSLILPFRRRVDTLLETLPLTVSDVPASVAKMMHGQEGMYRTPEQPRPSKTPKISSQMVSWHLQAMCLLRGLDKAKAVDAEAEAVIAALPSADEMMDEYLADKRPTNTRFGWANACESRSSLPRQTRTYVDDRYLIISSCSHLIMFSFHHLIISSSHHLTMTVSARCTFLFTPCMLSQSCWSLRFMPREVNTSWPWASWRRPCGRIWMPSR